MVAGERSQRKGRLPADLPLQSLDDALGHLLGVAEQHHGVVVASQVTQEWEACVGGPMERLPRYLYRGVNSDLYRAAEGKLRPKACGEEFMRAIYYGEGVYYGDGTVYGRSERNAVIMHQRDSTRYPTSGVSTTPIYENAVRYATHDGRHPSGYVYKIDTTLLEAYGVRTYPVDLHAVRPAIPIDREVILVARDYGLLPDGIVVDAEEIRFEPRELD
jgi:hypothetical protein